MTKTDSNWSSRKLGAESSATRAALVAAAQKLIMDEGYAAVTSRRVASVAGLKPQLVHYYFRSMDDLLLEVLRLSFEQAVELLEDMLNTDQPLRALWAFSSDPRGIGFTSEFHALAARNETIRAELARCGETLREMQTQAIIRYFEQRGVKPRMPPVLVTVLTVSLANVLVRERELGMSMGHAEADALVEQCLRGFEEDPNYTLDLFAEVKAP
jgi:AcrR family transcriptional regulator